MKMNLEARIEALEQVRHPPKLVFLIQRLDKDRDLNELSCEGKVWTRRARESVEDFHSRVVRDLGNPPGTMHVFGYESDLNL